jgi:tRNA nucleotidyltransferase (CCA-adding enzyme)
MNTEPTNASGDNLATHCQRIAELVRKAGGRALMVGGAVRDGLLGLPLKDADIEVFGLPAEELRAVLRSEYFVIEVGASFGVFKLRGVEADVSLPRRESKCGTGHRGFNVVGDPSMSVAEAASRRDFTINALYRDILTGELIDPCGGLADLAARQLRHCGPAFCDDPLRVLRAMQFIARFDFRAAPETVEVCRAMTIENLP